MGTPLSPQKLVIASRESRLALWQALHVQARLKSLYPSCEVAIEGMTTRGDQILDRALSKVGGKGLFIKELEVALIEGRCDLAVHSLKDVPMELDAQFAIAAVLEREDPRDAFVSNRYARLEDLPAGAVVGTSSLRREALLRERMPHLEVRALRGNLDTRLSKLDRGDYDAIVLAAAGLMRLGLEARIRQRIEPETSLPAPGQGALGIEVLATRVDLVAALRPLAHLPTWACVTAERAVSQRLGGSCEIPLAAYATLSDGVFDLRGLVARTDGSQVVRGRSQSACTAITDLGWASAIGERLAEHLIGEGALSILPGAPGSRGG